MNKDKDQGQIRIVVLQRGWVVIGKVYKQDNELRIENCSVIRVWGTTKGLGELATGPTSNTVLDHAGTVRVHCLNVVLEIECNQSDWKDKL